MGMVSLVVAVIAIILSFFIPIFGLIGGLIGLILGIIIHKKRYKNSIESIIISTIAVLISTILLILGINISSDDISNTLEPSKKELFVKNANLYVKTLRNEINSTEYSMIGCSEKSVHDSNEVFELDELNDGDYYFFLATNQKTLSRTHANFAENVASQVSFQTTALMLPENDIILSPWDRKNLYGWIHWKKEKGKITKYFIALTDTAGHGIDKEVESDRISKDIIKTKNAQANVDEILNIIDSNENIYFCLI